MLTINSPIHIAKLRSEILNANKENIHKPGCYIWGFMYSKNKRNILNFNDYNEIPEYDSSKHQFIPYYVGESGNIYSRLGQHTLVRSMDAGKFARFKMGYQFWMDIPRQYENGRGKFLPSYISIAQNGNIIYYNKQDVMLEAYGKNKKKSQIISQQFLSDLREPSITDLESLLGIKDPLEDIVHLKDNFWCMILTKDEVEPNHKNPLDFNSEKTRHEIENLLYLSLKGGTISRCYRDKINTKLIVLDKSNTNVFHLNALGHLVHAIPPYGTIDPDTFQETSRTPY
jgi:hypothetical protein